MAVYFDQASTTPVDKQIRETYQKVLEKYYVNSESLYPDGAKVSGLMEQSRCQAAELLKVQPEELIFTSGGSEANNLAIKGTALACRNQGRHIITSLIEHSSVVNSCHWLNEYAGCEITNLPIHSDGQIDTAALEKAIRPDTILVSVMMVNNESGAIQPIEEVKRICRLHPQVRLHVDCVQALGKMPINLQGIDLASFSAHKIHGLKGSGLLYRKANLQLAPLISGGQQEYGLRGGTADAPADMMWGKTLRLAIEKQQTKYQTLIGYHDRMYQALAEMPNVVVNSPINGSPAIINFSCRKITSQVMLNALSDAGYLVSAQSTCDSRDAVSRVMAQMFTDHQRLAGTIRISLDYDHSSEQVDGLIAAIREIVEKYGK